MLSEIFTKYSKYKNYLLAYCVIACSLMIKLIYFYKQIESPIPPLAQARGPLLYTLSNVFIFLLPFFLIKKRYSFLLLYLFFIDLILIANAAYYRYYANVIPIFSYYSNLRELWTLKGEVGTYIIWKDLFHISLTGILTLAYFLWGKKRIKSPRRKKRILLSLFPLLIALILFSSGVLVATLNNQSISDFFYERNHKQHKFVSYFGPISLWIYQLSKQLYTDKKPLTEKEYQEIDKFILQRKSEHTLRSPSNKNLIVIIVESLSTWPTQIKETEITPFLNKISKQPDNIYIPNTLPQTLHGRSADGQLMINTGLLPVRENSVAYWHAAQYFPSLAEALKQRNYYSATIMGNEKFSWNQKTMNIAYHIDTLISRENLIPDEIIGIGISDKSVFKQTIPILKKFKEPFYVQFITTSSHNYLSDFENYPDSMNLDEKLPKDVQGYLKAINYTDDAIRLCFELLQENDLLKNTCVVIASDHEGMTSDKIKDFYPGCLSPYEQENNTTFIPLYVVNVDLKPRRHEGQVIGQIDIYPSILDIMSLDSYKWRGVGTSVFSEHSPQFAVDKTLQVIGKTDSIPGNEIEHKIEAWSISDLIIRKKYFEYIKQAQ